MGKQGIQASKSMALSALILLVLPVSRPAQAQLILSSGPYAFSGSAGVTDTKQTTGATTNNGASMGANTVINQFNPALGVLVGTTHQLSSSRTMTISGSGTGGTGTATGSATGNTRLVTPGMSASFGSVSSPNGSCSSTTTSCSYPAVSTTVATNGSYGVAITALDAYVGTGTVTASRNAPNLSVTSGGTKPTTQATATESWSGTLTTRYDYLLHAVPTFDGNLPTSVLMLNFGDVWQHDAVNPLLFSIFNLSDPDRVSLDLDMITGSGDTAVLSTDIGTFMNLMPGSFFDFSAFIDTSALGNFNASYQLMFSDGDVGAETSRNNDMMLTLNLNGNVVPMPVTEPSALALFGAGIIGLAWRGRTRRSSVVA